MAKTDMERVGLFTEQGYTTIGDPYVPPGRSKMVCIDSLTIIHKQGSSHEISKKS